MDFSAFVNALILLVLVAGHTELVVTLINRVHGLPLPQRFLRQLRHWHDVWVPAFPLLLVWRVGLDGPRVLAGGSWAELGTGWRVYLALCAVGAVGLCVHLVRGRLQRVPSAQVSNHSWTVDMQKRLGRRPVAPGPFRFLTYVPGNEIFRVEVSVKEYRLPRLPKQWDGLSVLHLSDLHFIGTIERAFFEEVVELGAELNCDLAVLTGDLLDHQRLVEWLPTTLGRLSCPLGCYFVLGNHDWSLDPEQTRQWLTDLGWKDAGGRCFLIDHKGSVLALAGTERPWMGRHPDLTRVPAHAFRVLLSHTPDNLAWARRNRVDLMLCGHNHGGQVRLPLVGPVYSPSLHGCMYAGGAYWKEPTLLYVSRGLSGRHPLRLNCQPELTKLVLRAQ